MKISSIPRPERRFFEPSTIHGSYCSVCRNITVSKLGKAAQTDVTEVPDAISGHHRSPQDVDGSKLYFLFRMDVKSLMGGYVLEHGAPSSHATNARFVHCASAHAGEMPSMAWSFVNLVCLRRRRMLWP